MPDSHHFILGTFDPHSLSTISLPSSTLGVAWCSLFLKQLTI